MKKHIIAALLALFTIATATFAAPGDEVKPPDVTLIFVVSDRLAKTTIESEPAHRWDYFRKVIEVLLVADLNRDQVFEVEKSINNIFAAIGRGVERRPNTVAFFQGEDIEKVRGFLATAEAGLKLKSKLAKK